MVSKVSPRAGEAVTVNYGWTKPTVGASTDAWGGYINTDLDGIDSVVHNIQTSLANYLPLAGGTVTGATTFNSTTSHAGAATFKVNPTIGGGTGVAYVFPSGSVGFTSGSGVGVWSSLATAGAVWLDTNANFNFLGGGVAYKAGGGSWTATSDARVKTVEGEYAKGLTDVMALRPVIFRYKGNDASTADGGSPHAVPAAAGTAFVGLIAQEAETVFPGMVAQRSGYIDGVLVDDLRDLNVSELIFALVNAVKTLSARVEALEAAR